MKTESWRETKGWREIMGWRDGDDFQLPLCELIVTLRDTNWIVGAHWLVIDKMSENHLIKRKMSDSGRPGVTGPKELSTD